MGSTAKDLFDEQYLIEFWPLMINFPKVIEKLFTHQYHLYRNFIGNQAFQHFYKKKKKRKQLD